MPAAATANVPDSGLPVTGNNSVEAPISGSGFRQSRQSNRGQLRRV
jgi:hypothetical protein